MKGLIIYSGGMDSTTLLYQYQNDIKLAVSFNYGSKHNEIELRCAKYHCDKLKIRHIVIDLGFINEHFKSDLLQNGGDIPEGSYTEDNMKSTIVPFRNGIMLSIATGMAESNELDTLFIANHFGDHAIYPDCTSEFIQSMGRASYYGTTNRVQIQSPYCNKSKRDIALIGKALNVDYSTTYSCYNGQNTHCGKCATCIERKEALEGFDKTKYQI